MPNAKSRLELRGPRSQDREAARLGPRDGRVEQRRLADAGVALDEQEAPRAPSSRVEQVVDGPQLRLSLEEDLRVLGSDGDWSVFRQKTRELP